MLFKALVDALFPFNKWQLRRPGELYNSIKISN